MIIADEELIKNFLEKDDEKALEVLILRYLKPLYNFVLQLTGDGKAAEDIVQEVFVKVWKKADSFDLDKKFSTWIYAIAKNATFDHFKKKKTLPFAAFENEDGTNALENIEDQAILHPNALLERMDDVRNVHELLNTLSPKLKTILLLHHKQGFSLVEIAEILGTPSNTIKSNYRRALIFLKKTSSLGSANEDAPRTIPAA
ncbi:MAG: sigma-70 family RNA polymerase sigma factor [Candidatus Moranbacteria bacterium]|nr:sigma-70 family RNA polymerase sigma factor [Candidatus Moranbacteria bacterium]